MKKKQIILVALLIFLRIGFAQNVEIDSAEYYFEQKNLAKAKGFLENAAKLLESNRHIVDDDQMALYLYLKGEVFYSMATSDNLSIHALDSNALRKAVKSFADLKKFENSPSFITKNKDTGKREYFDSKEEAEKAIANGNYSKLRDRTRRHEYSNKANLDLITRSEDILRRANEEYKAKNYVEAGKYFVSAYYLYEAIGTENTPLLYNAAISFLLGKDHENPISILKNLIDRGYTGVRTVYTAINVETGDKTSFTSEADMNLYIKTKKYKDPKITTTKSEELNLYRYLASSYEGVNKLDEAISTLEKAYKKFPNNSDLIKELGNLYYKKGDDAAFEKTILDGLKTDPNNYTLLYSMGFMKAKEGDDKSAKDYYKKAIEANPKFVPSYLNLAGITLQKEKEIVDEINNLGFSKLDIAREKILKSKQKEIFKDALSVLEKARKQAPRNRKVLTALRGIYYNLNMDSQYDQINALIKEVDAE